MKNAVSKILFVAMIFCVNISIANDASLESSDCQAGGPGAVSCQASTTVDTTVLGSGASVTNSASVTCGSGYYACCNSSLMGASANCVAN